MQLNHFSITALVTFVLLNHVLSITELLKPSFFPYCITRNKCQPACTCEVVPNCTVRKMTDEIRKSILAHHNELRQMQSTAEPQAARMTMLKYDDQLEAISDCWAAKCEQQYSECFITPRYSETSQATGQYELKENETVNGYSWIKMINFWVEQASFLTAENMNSLPSGAKGESLHNYAQVMSDRILAVGCSCSAFQNRITFICTYGPRGSRQGEPIYKSGTPCSQCPEYYMCDDKKPLNRLCKEIREATAVPITPPLLPPKPTDRKIPTATSVIPLIPPKLPPKPPERRSYVQRENSPSFRLEQGESKEYSLPQQNQNMGPFISGHNDRTRGLIQHKKHSLVSMPLEMQSEEFLGGNETLGQFQPPYESSEVESFLMPDQQPGLYPPQSIPKIPPEVVLSITEAEPEQGQASFPEDISPYPPPLPNWVPSTVDSYPSPTYPSEELVESNTGGPDWTPLDPNLKDEVKPKIINLGRAGSTKSSNVDSNSCSTKKHTSSFLYVIKIIFVFIYYFQF